MAKVKKAEAVEIPYPEVSVSMHQADNPVTVDLVKDLLGYEEETADSSLKDYDFIWPNGQKAKLHRNAHNRPIDMNWVLTLAQDILNRHWADSRNGEGRTLNGETFVIGRHGNALSMQHRGLALIWAEKERTGEDAEYWKEKWGDQPVSIEGIIVYGVDESTFTTRTIDNCKKRTLADVLFSGDLFKKQSTSERAALTRITDKAVKILWERTGAKTDAHSPRRTNAEAVDFIQRHERLLKAVSFIYGLDADGQVSSGLKISTGVASALMYLMAASGTDPDKYHPTPSERKANFGEWKRAEEFWTLLVGNNEQMKVTREALAALFRDRGDSTPTMGEKMAVLIKAWNLYRGGEEPKKRDLSLAYTDKDGRLVLDDFPKLGGMDLGAYGVYKTEDVGDEPTTVEEEEWEGQEETPEPSNGESNGHMEVKMEVTQPEQTGDQDNLEKIKEKLRKNRERKKKVATATA